MDREKLHQEVEDLNGAVVWYVRAIAHLLIDLGRVDSVECQLADCVLEKRTFKKRVRGRGYDAYAMTIDHIEPRHRGGGHRAENLRLLHHACNMACTKGRVDPEAVRNKKKEAAARRLADPVKAAAWKAAVLSRRPGWNQMTRPDDRRRAGSGRNSRARLLTDAQVRAARKSYAQGKKLEQLAEKYGVSRSTIHSAVSGKGAYSEAT